MYEYLYEDNVEMFTLEEIKLFMLLFADDMDGTALFSYTKSGLQLLLDKLYMYCHEWRIIVNPVKSFVIVCNKILDKMHSCIMTKLWNVLMWNKLLI
jgi:hypothetical protein